MFQFFKKLEEKKELKKKKRMLEKYGKYTDPNGIIYFDSTRWVGPTRMRKYC